MNDFERVARVIRHLHAHQVEQPDLADLAACAGLSPYHFHRLFTRWAGVTPKDFLQCLTLEHARERLRRGESVLGTTIEVGLSSPSRLHDLCVALEAASPGEIKSGGDGWRIEAGFTDTPFGRACVGIGPRGVCHLAFVGKADRAMAWAPIAAAWPRARLVGDNGAARELGERIFRTGPGGDGTGKLRGFVRGTPFQLRVWRALVQVPAGVMVTYGQLAATVGQPTAARAVGTAVGSNPIAYLIPCHRVIRQTGVIGEYRWGADRKRIMLGWEGASSKG
ncbi:MAG: methylated-DNA--[protein]-cysteine S-methyltransferase [Limisphaerales bacterium]